jgi:hypothetical protein
MYLIKYFTGHLQSIFGNQIILKLALVLLPFFIRERLYQSWVTYRIDRPRGFQPTLEPRLQKAVAEHPEVYDRHLSNGDKIAHAALKVTADFLTYNGDSTDKTDPLSIWQAQSVNSTSFATFFMATTQYLLQKNGLADRYTCQQYIAERYSGNKNLCDRFKSPYGGSPFNQMRDIVAVIDLKTGEKRYFDPTIFEQTSIVDIKISHK